MKTSGSEARPGRFPGAALAANWFWAALAVVLAALPAMADSGLETVRLQLKWQHQFQFAGYYAAIERGYFADEGLEVVLIEAEPGEDPAEVVLRGDAEYGVGTSEILLWRDRGHPVVLLAPIFQHSPLVLLSRADSGATDIHQLRGRRLMIEPQSAELFAYFRMEGMETDWLTIMPHSQNVTDLIEGRVDAMSAYSTDEPFLLREAGIDYRVFMPRAGGIDFYGDNLFTTREQLRGPRERARTEAFLRACLRGWEYAMEHPQEMADLILKRYGDRKSREHLLFEAERMRQLMHPDLIAIGHSNPGRWRHIAQTYAGQGMLDNPPDALLSGFLYEPGPVERDLRPFYWALGILLGLALAALAVLVPVSRLNLKLREAKNRAEEADRAKGEFLALISHEIRTPLNGVLGFSGLLRRTGLNKEQKSQLEMIEMSANGLLTLINDLLDFSRTEAGKIDLEIDDFSLPRFVDSVEALFRPVAEEKQLKFTVETGSGLPEWVRGDVFRLRQILNNLLANAFKFTAEGSVRLRVFAPAESAGDGDTLGICFEVADTGIGIPPEARQVIFEPFHQADVSTARKFGGTGLGLAIASKLSSIMGGSLTLRSVVGEGSVFTAEVALRRGNPATRDGVVEPDIPEGETGAFPGAVLRVLVADDNAVNLRLAKSILTRAGCAVEEAANGEEAVGMAGSRHYDMILMDVRMPDVDGIEAIRRIRDMEKADPGSAHRRIVAVSAGISNTDREACLRAGADGFLPKPFTVAQLLNQLPFPSSSPGAGKVAE